MGEVCHKPLGEHCGAVLGDKANVWLASAPFSVCFDHTNDDDDDDDENYEDYEDEDDDKDDMRRQGKRQISLRSISRVFRIFNFSQNISYVTQRFVNFAVNHIYFLVFKFLLLEMYLTTRDNLSQ